MSNGLSEVEQGIVKLDFERIDSDRRDRCGRTDAPLLLRERDHY